MDHDENALWIFDLDHTLLDTNRLLKACVAGSLSAYGISWQLFERALALDRKKRETGAGNIFESLAELVPVLNKREAQKKFVEWISENCRDFLYPDVFEIIPRLEGDKILLTRGARSIQEAKISNRDFRNLFSRTIITNQMKVIALKALAKEFGGRRMVLADDSEREHAAALDAFPELVSVWIRREGASERLFAHHRCFVVQNMYQLEKIFAKFPFVSK